MNRVVALKMIRSGQLARTDEVHRFKAEATAAGILDHPGIVPIYEVGEFEGNQFYSMAFVDGVTLAERLKQGPLPNRIAAGYLKKIAEAIAYAHSKGVIHRDIKPANVLIDRNDQPKVTDFGLAKQLQYDSTLTASGQVLGTPSYMSPEQAAGRSKQISERSDVYSLGATLYCLLVGRPPFLAASLSEMIRQVLEDAPVPIRRLNQEVPRDLETICDKCMRKEAAGRYATAKQLVG